ncbi:prolyl oligopeptidase family serine peptidase [Micromonospora haikouensis]|uniref:prolyl oligopeptidase family serine peptidase n=1 Tax=Micromonospora haikouensis TaxID=686309 RepID=UPI0033ED7310
MTAPTAAEACSAATGTPVTTSAPAGAPAGAGTPPPGAWPSPFRPQDAAAAGGEPRWLIEQWVVAHGDTVWFTDLRPAEGGRAVLCRWTAASGVVDAVPAGFSARSRFQEYGGRPFTVVSADAAVVSRDTDQRLYLVAVGPDAALPRPLTPCSDGRHRYAEGTVVGDEVWCVRERRTGPRTTDVLRDLVAVPLTGHGDAEPWVLGGGGHRFLAGLRVAPDGRHAAWLGWDHPDMPWDAARLRVAPIVDGRLGGHRVLAGGDAEAVCQAEWLDAGTLLALTDPDGWWNPYAIGLDGDRRPLWRGDREAGGALWRPGQTWAAPLADGRIALAVTGWYGDGARRPDPAAPRPRADGPRHGTRLAVLDPARGVLDELDLPYTVWGPVSATGTTVAAMAASPDRQPALVRVDTATGRADAVTGDRYHTPGPGWLPVGEHRRFPVPGGEVHAVVYPPRNPAVAADPGHRPPLLVVAHGGPTGRVTDALDPETLLFTSRGYAVALVDYGGSTGFGRAWRDRLRGGWGVVDVADCAAVARALAAEGAVDGDRVALRGGSAGGWTTCAALTSVDTFRCGAAYFPVLDPLAWAEGETHDLESHYLHGLIGPLPAARPTYADRAPVHRAARLAGPLLLLQGEEDTVCPLAPAERFVAALADAGAPHTYLRFPGEGHVFRQVGSITRALDAELALYASALRPR